VIFSADCAVSDNRRWLHQPAHPSGSFLVRVRPMHQRLKLGSVAAKLAVLLARELDLV